MSGDKKVLAQRVLDVIADKARAELFGPLGLSPKFVPIAGEHNVELALMGSYGRTRVDPDNGEPKAIFITMELNQNPLQATATLVHEMLHTSLPPIKSNFAAHRAPDFVKYAAELGLAKPYHFGYPSAKMVEWYNASIKPELERLDIVPDQFDDVDQLLAITREERREAGEEVTI